jgi:hypothetical protein
LIDDQVPVQLLDVLPVAGTEPFGQRSEKSTNIVISAITPLKDKAAPCQISLMARLTPYFLHHRLVIQTILYHVCLILSSPF